MFGGVAELQVQGIQVFVAPRNLGSRGGTSSIFNLHGSFFYIQAPYKYLNHFILVNKLRIQPRSQSWSRAKQDLFRSIKQAPKLISRSSRSPQQPTGSFEVRIFQSVLILAGLLDIHATLFFFSPLFISWLDYLTFMSPCFFITLHVIVGTWNTRGSKQKIKIVWGLHVKSLASSS